MVAYPKMSPSAVLEDENDVSQTANCDYIPVLDLSSLNSPDIDDRRKLAGDIYDACTQVGFFYIKASTAKEPRPIRF